MAGIDLVDSREGPVPVVLEDLTIGNARLLKQRLVVDHVIGGHQTVIKNLGEMLKAVPEMSGATIMGNGNVALVLMSAGS